MSLTITKEFEFEINKQFFYEDVDIEIERGEQTAPGADYSEDFWYIVDVEPTNKHLVWSTDMKQAIVESINMNELEKDIEEELGTWE